MRDGRAEGSSAGGDRGQNATAVTPDFDGTHVCILESFQLEGLHVGDLPCGFKVSLVSISPPVAFHKSFT